MYEHTCIIVLYFVKQRCQGKNMFVRKCLAKATQENSV
jgi:hypothetical protein